MRDAPRPPAIAGYQAPLELGEESLKAYTAVMQFLADAEMLWSGGQTVFYSPEQWQRRGELYGTDALLIVCHDGGEHRPAFYNYGEPFKFYNGLRAHLKSQGFWVECCTCWYSAIYPTAPYEAKTSDSH